MTNKRNLTKMKSILLVLVLFLTSLTGFSQSYRIDTYKAEQWKKSFIQGRHKNVLEKANYQKGYVSINLNTDILKISLNGVDFSLEKITKIKEEDNIIYFEFEGGQIMLTRGFVVLDYGGPHFLALYYKEFKETFKN